MEEVDQTRKSAKYEVIVDEKLVRVKVPSRGSHYLNVVPGHNFETDGEMIPVPTHYRHGQKIGDTDIIVNRHFYGVTENDLGMTILATVKVVRKTTGGRTFIMLDIIKEERVDGIFPKKTLKIMPSVVPQAKPWGFFYFVKTVTKIDPAIINATPASVHTVNLSPKNIVASTKTKIILKRSITATFVADASFSAQK